MNVDLIKKSYKMKTEYNFLSKYIEKKRKTLRDLEKEIEILESADSSVTIETLAPGHERLISNDYSLATDFKIKKRSEDLEDVSGYSGGYRTCKTDYFPQFFFYIGDEGQRQVDIRQDGFEKDERVVLRSITVTNAWKDYSDRAKMQENPVDVEATLEFFKQRGVNEELLEKLNRRIEEWQEIGF